MRRERREKQRGGDENMHKKTWDRTFSALSSERRHGGLYEYDNLHRGRDV